MRAGRSLAGPAKLRTAGRPQDRRTTFSLHDSRCRILNGSTPFHELHRDKLSRVLRLLQRKKGTMSFG